MTEFIWNIEKIKERKDEILDHSIRTILNNAILFRTTPENVLKAMLETVEKDYDRSRE